MIVDSSAIVAIAQDEAEAGPFALLLEDTSDVRVSAATVVEASIVLGRIGQQFLDSWLASTRTTVTPVDAEQARVARRAYLDYGKGSGSPARLNFGDCFSYALAKVTGRPLLFKGDDFAHTDITPAYLRGESTDRR